MPRGPSSRARVAAGTGPGWRASACRISSADRAAGTPLTERTWGYGNTLPDRVLIFQGPHERDSEDEDDLVVAIGETLIHEIGHYFGLSEEEIEEIEEKYWRGEE